MRRAQQPPDGEQRVSVVDAHSDTSVAVLDLAYLRSMTVGDRALEAEVLGLFAAQAEQLSAALASNTGAATPMALHTIKGAARGIGAVRVSRMAELAERATGPARQAAAVAGLVAALDQARTAIAAHLRLL
jgi:HPt (histidine-containing phosphotransfer) domain-containing protein